MPSCLNGPNWSKMLASKRIDRTSAAEAASAASVLVSALIARARTAQSVADTYDQAQVDQLVAAAGWAIIEPARNRELAELAVTDTGIGNVEDKVRKNHRKTFGLLRDLSGARSVGVIAEYPERGIIEIARPVGVVAAITPSTNPAATPANKIINALKGRNAVIVAPSPKGWSTCARLLEFVHAQFDRINAPRDLVQMLQQPVTKESTTELMRQADLVVATGSQRNVNAAYTSGTPAFGVGAGNVAAIVDETADLNLAAERIITSKTFDNATSCSSENSVVLLDAVYAPALDAFKARGAVLLPADAKSRLQQTMWPDGKLSADVIGQSAATIAKRAGLSMVPENARALMVEEDGIGPNHPFSGEKLSPVLTVYRARDFDRRDANRRANLCFYRCRALGWTSQRSTRPCTAAGPTASGLSCDRQSSPLRCHRRQLRQRVAVFLVDGVRNLGP